MTGRGFIGWFLLLLLALWHWNGQGWAQPTRGEGVNYKLVPNLEPLKDKSPTPDFTLPTPYSAGARELIKVLLDEKR